MPVQQPSREQRRIEYDEYLASPQWRSFRLKVLERDGHACVVCNTTKNLDVHHRTYERFGNEELADCYTLCREHHEVFHGRRFDAPKKKAKPKKQRDRFHGMPAQAEECEQVFAIMQLRRSYRTDELARAAGMSTQRAGTVLASLRKAKKVTRTKRGKLWSRQSEESIRGAEIGRTVERRLRVIERGQIREYKSKPAPPKKRAESVKLIAQLFLDSPAGTTLNNSEIATATGLSMAQVNGAIGAMNHYGELVRDGHGWRQSATLESLTAELQADAA